MGSKTHTTTEKLWDELQNASQYNLPDDYEVDGQLSMFDNEYKNTESIEKIYKKGPVLPSDEVMKVSYIIQPKPMYKETGPFVRKIVRIKKGVIRRVRRLIGR